MEKRLVLEDHEGRVLRAFQWAGPTGEVIHRRDTRRLEVWPSTDNLKKKNIPFKSLGRLTRQDLEKTPFLVGSLGHLRLVEEVGETLKDRPRDKDDDRRWYLILGSLTLVFILLMVYVRTLPTMTPKIEQNLKQQVVKIIKNFPLKPKVQVANFANQSQKTLAEAASAKKATGGLQHRGALGALGSLSSGKQKGGLDLGAVNTSAGPGLGGGTQGSEGVQTTLYGKGVVAAPVGVGGRIEGAGGYGTKGKGGGQAGYGKLSLAGSAGTSSIALTQEATVASGLDRDQIAAVINKNLGQVRFCYEQGLQTDPQLNGRVAVAFTIGGRGAVKMASVESTSMNSKAVEDCILMRLKTWQFPLPLGGVDVNVTYPFVLRRAGQG